MKYPISPYVQFRLALKYVIKKYWHRKQKALAAEAGISEPMISYAVKGKENLSLKSQIAIAEAAGYSYEGFLALGRLIHQKVSPEKLPKPSKSYGRTKYSASLAHSAADDHNSFDQHGGYDGHTTTELVGDDKMSSAVSKLMKIYESGDDKIIRIINRLLDEICAELADGSRTEEE